MVSLSRRRRRIRAMGIIYEASMLATLSDTIALKAAEEPMLMRPRRRLRRAVTAIELRGREERVLT